MSFIVQAITTKYIGPTNYRGARIKAAAYAGSVTVPYAHELNIEGNHARAAKALAEKFHWQGEWHQGGDTAQGYVFVNAGKEPAFVTTGARVAA